MVTVTEQKRWIVMLDLIFCIFVTLHYFFKHYYIIFYWNYKNLENGYTRVLIKRLPDNLNVYHIIVLIRKCLPDF